MTDIVDPSTRSKIMASICGKNTKPELRVRRGLHQLGMRFRLHRRDLPGSPDVVFPKHRAVLFVHGCFWHRHTCRLAYTPSSNSEKWGEKFKANIERDRAQVTKLMEDGWRVFVIWECAIRAKDLGELLVAVADELRTGERNYREWPTPLGETQVHLSMEDLTPNFELHSASKGCHGRN